MDKNVIKRRYNNWKARCKSRELSNTISFEEYQKLVVQKTCYYTGVKLVTAVDQHDKRPNTWTLERIDSKVGYIQGNVVVCSHEANQFKNSFFELANCWEQQAKLLKNYELYKQINGKISPVQQPQQSVSKFRQILNIIFS